MITVRLSCYGSYRCGTGWPPFTVVVDFYPGAHISLSITLIYLSRCHRQPYIQNGMGSLSSILGYFSPSRLSVRWAARGSSWQNLYWFLSFIKLFNKKNACVQQKTLQDEHGLRSGRRACPADCTARRGRHLLRELQNSPQLNTYTISCR